MAESGRFEEITWVDPYPNRLPRLSDFRREVGIDRVEQSIDIPSLNTIGVRSWPLEPIPGGNWVNHSLFWKPICGRLRRLSDSSSGGLIIGIGRPSALALWALSNLSWRDAFYDAMDDFPAFYKGLSRWSMMRIEREIVQRVPCLWYTAPSIGQRLEGLSGDVQYVPNAADMNALPAVSKGNNIGKTDREGVAGYVGTIGEWFDWPLLIRFAQSCPTIEVRLIGPVFAQAPRLPTNVVLLGKMSHQDALHEMAAFDVGLIPFKLNRLTESVDPIKYYEYVAMGKPVLSTPFGTMVEHAKEGFVHFFQEYDYTRDFVLAQDCAPTVEEVRRFRALNSWHGRFKSVLEGLEIKVHQECVS